MRTSNPEAVPPLVARAKVASPRAWPGRRAALLGLLLVLATACSEAPTDGKIAGKAALDPSTLVLRTDTGGADARAGVPFTVGCRAFEKADGGLGAEVTLPWPTTVTVVDGPAGALAIDGHDVSFGLVGDYRVACRTVGEQLLDAEGALLPVIPGPPASLDTQIASPAGDADVQHGAAAVVAGTPIQVSCIGADAHGNPLTTGWTVGTTPEIVTSDLLLQPTLAGTYDVACRIEGSVDATPARLGVIANVPKHLHTLLEPAEIEAGNAAKLGCVALDAYGNQIKDFPFAVDHSDKLALKGLYLSATEAGLHGVRCVPETLAWDLFTLHGNNLLVTPGPPKELLVARIPDKGVYKRKETVKFIATVRDGYGNIRPDDEVAHSVVSPAKGYKDKGDLGIVFNLDGTYELEFHVVKDPNVEKVFKLLVDGAPPLLTIEEPGWGSTLDGKPSVTVKGKAGDDGAGIAELKVNGKKAFPDAIDEWKVQVGAAHGLTKVIATATDIGGEEAKAVRGFYYANKYYPTDAANPKGAMVDKAIQVFLGKDFFDDGDHNKAKVDDMATIIEIVAGGLMSSSLLPSNISQGDIEVTLSNTKFGPLKTSLVPVDGALQTKIELDGISTDLAVKAKLKLGPISTTVKVSGDIKIAKVRLSTRLGIEVVNGFAKTDATQTVVQIDDMKLHVDGIGGLFDFLWNILLDTYKKQMEAQIVGMLESELPKALQGIFDALAINQSFEVPPLVGAGKTVTVSIVSAVKTMTFSPLGAIIEMDASFVASKGVPHTIKGSIGRDGCVGLSPDKFAIDTAQRIQFALHDDLINQLLYALWYGGALQLSVPLAELAGGSNVSGFSLEGATLGLDFLLPPILEACNQPDPMSMRLQVGDLFAKITLMLGSDPLDLHTVILADAGLSLAFSKASNGDGVLTATVAQELGLVLHLQDITKGFEDQKPTFQKLIESMLTKGLTDANSPLGKPTETALPATVIDLSTAVPGLPPGSKLTVGIGKLERAGGYTAVSMSLQ